MSTTELKHSALPWYDDGYRVYAATEDADKRNGRVIFEYKHVDEPNDADYPFIVRAVNSHADMLEALEEALGYVFTAANGMAQGGDPAPKILYKKALAAIAKAKGGTA